LRSHLCRQTTRHWRAAYWFHADLGRQELTLQQCVEVISRSEALLPRCADASARVHLFLLQRRIDTGQHRYAFFSD
jgi:hypothetical protein